MVIKSFNDFLKYDFMIEKNYYKVITKFVNQNLCMHPSQPFTTIKAYRSIDKG